MGALTATLLMTPGVAAGAQADEQSLVRVAHFAPGLLKGDLYVVYVNGRLELKGVPFKTVSDYLKVEPGTFEVEVREAGEPASSPPVIAATVGLAAGKAYTVAVFGQLTSVKAALLTAGSAGAEVRETGTGEALAKADNVKPAGGAISSLVAVGGVGEKTDLLVLNDAAAAVAAAGGVATGAGGTAPSSPGGGRFALTLLIGCGLAAVTGFIVQQRRSSG